jgi:hypothetical protein
MHSRDSKLAREIYRSWSSDRPTLPIWHQPWWLDATAGEQGWSAVSAGPVASFVVSHPYVVTRRFGYKILDRPPLTHALGPWFSSGDTEVEPSLSTQHKLLRLLVDALPKVHFYRQNWMPEIRNWIPFYWRDFKETTRYTYQLDLTSGQEELWNKLQGRCRSEIRKGENTSLLQIEETFDLNDISKVMTQTFENKGLRLPFDPKVVERILQSGKENGHASAYIAKDITKETCAFAVIVRDRTTAYYILGGVSDKYRSSGAMSLVLWNAIQDSHNRGLLKFDFEGSMIEPIERFFRSFGATQTPYFYITKIFTAPIRIALSLFSK